MNRKSGGRVPKAADGEVLKPNYPLVDPTTLLISKSIDTDFPLEEVNIVERAREIARWPGSTPLPYHRPRQAVHTSFLDRLSRRN